MIDMKMPECLKRRFDRLVAVTSAEFWVNWQWNAPRSTDSSFSESEQSCILENQEVTI